MVQISGSQVIYRRLVEEADESWLFGLVAFAIVEEQRIEWMNHYEEHNGQLPSEDEVRHWYEQQPEGVLLRAKGEAENALQLYADDVLQEILQVERREASEGVIVREIRLARKFWPQFGFNVAAGFVSAVLFAAVLVVLAFVVFSDPSPVEIGKEITGNQEEERVNGNSNDEP